MKYQHVRRIFKSPFYVNLKKHYCPDCYGLLGKTKVSRIVNSHSPEAKDFDFHNVDNYMIDDVKFIWTEFLCPKCNRHYSIDEMKRIEKEQKRGCNK